MSLNTLKQTIKPLQKELQEHPIYSSIKTLDHLKLFMSHHIFAVWDFMNLLKTLQSRLTCIDIPWHPASSPTATRLINEIVLEEESDSIDDQFTSHFAYYHHALKQLDPNYTVMDQFLADLRSGTSYADLIKQPYIPSAAQEFMKSTYEFIQGSTPEIAAAFTYGREIIIPDMFSELIQNAMLQKHPELQTFITYLERHIELDGDVHGHLAEQMVIDVCKNENDWANAIKSSEKSINSRILLLNFINNHIF